MPGEMEQEKSMSTRLEELKTRISKEEAIDALRHVRARRSYLSPEERLLQAIWGVDDEELQSALYGDTTELGMLARIRFEMNDGSTIKEFSIILDEFHDAYTSIRFFLRRLERGEQSIHGLLDFPTPNPLPTLAQPILGAAKFNSPGFWEAIGNLNPLKILCDYLSQRHERNKDNNYRNQIEKELGELEVLAKRNELISSQVETLKKAGFADQEIKELMSKYISGSLERLGKRVDNGQIIAVSVEMEPGVRDNNRNKVEGD